MLATNKASSTRIRILSLKTFFFSFLLKYASTRSVFKSYERFKLRPKRLQDVGVNKPEVNNCEIV